MGQTRSFGDVGSMSGLQESGHGCLAARRQGGRSRRARSSRQTSHASADIAMSGLSARFASLEHDPEKWTPVFRKDHAQTKEI
jgi:hypothetical protein